MTETSALRAALEVIRDRFVAKGTLTLPSVRFLLDLAVNDHDLGADQVADNVEALLTGEGSWERFLPPRRRAEPRRRDKAPIGPLVRVDSYACENDRLRVEVERAPGTDDVQSGHLGARVRDELLGVAPTCPECEREMTFVGRKLRKAR